MLMYEITTLFRRGSRTFCQMGGSKNLDFFALVDIKRGSVPIFWPSSACQLNAIPMSLR